MAWAYPAYSVSSTVTLGTYVGRSSTIISSWSDPIPYYYCRICGEKALAPSYYVLDSGKTALCPKCEEKIKGAIEKVSKGFWRSVIPTEGEYCQECLSHIKACKCPKKTMLDKLKI